MDWGTWTDGRLELRQVQRIAVNRKPGIGRGDVAMGGTHANVTVLVAKPSDRGWVDLTKGDPKWADTQYVWEHEHPYDDTVKNVFLTGEAWGLAFDPASGELWTSSEFRTFRVGGSASMKRPTVHQWWGDNAYLPALWSSATDPFDATARDNVQSLAFCDDGTMWIGSWGHGIARRDPSGNVTTMSLPSGLGDAVWSLACDPSDRSLWVGLAWGGIVRLKDGGWQGLPADAPDFAKNGPVRSIQIDRWASPRIVYFAHVQTTDSKGSVSPGGVSAYAGP